MTGLAMETSKAEPADRNQAKAKLNRDAYVDSFPYVESYVDRNTYGGVQSTGNSNDGYSDSQNQSLATVKCITSR
ncbi:peroxisomal membrane protein 13 [Dorcoceras hygrometricum]|uniref:Peroxisomal membrane protein 13 n=1 Tax=Dorcoceras hygrometricum TaxID=472368 RepID=A0A2Z6ZXB2_9LAMI|nr:peroxisomal membrane protein 13 [Dorcoceras hygrometricum]